jgi:hypothetical protein
MIAANPTLWTRLTPREPTVVIEAIVHILIAELGHDRIQQDRRHPPPTTGHRFHSPVGPQTGSTQSRKRV